MVFRQKCRRLDGLLRNAPLGDGVKHGGPLRTDKRDLIRPTKTPLASSDGNKMASRILPLPCSGSCTRGWRRRARSRRNYFLFSDPERGVDCLTSRPRPCAHACVRETLRTTFCSRGLIRGRSRQLSDHVSPTDVTQSPISLYL